MAQVELFWSLYGVMGGQDIANCQKDSPHGTVWWEGEQVHSHKIKVWPHLTLVGPAGDKVSIGPSMGLPR